MIVIYTLVNIFSTVAAAHAAVHAARRGAHSECKEMVAYAEASAWMQQIRR
jgi:hypothetical protein